MHTTPYSLGYQSTEGFQNVDVAKVLFNKLLGLMQLKVSPVIKRAQQMEIII